jgi:transcription elongation factor Elf1
VNWIDTKYVRLLSGRLDRFKQRGSVFNFRCPICGDSDKKNKARGYILSKHNKTNFYCHNCGTSVSLGNFIKNLDETLYLEYVKEKFLDENFKAEAVEQKDVVEEPHINDIEAAFRKVKKISQLGADHPARKYVQARLIDSRFHYKLYFTQAFQTFVNTIIPNKFENIVKDEPRLILALMDRDKKIFGFQGRSFKKQTDLRYITIILDDDKPRFFGLDSVDFTRKVIVFEGPIDSMMLSNSLASCGGDIAREMTKLDQSKDKFIITYDNEPRNPHTVKKMETAIKEGFHVTIWPENVKEKDANDMILNGITPLDLKTTIFKNNYSGLEAELKLNQWRKC